MRIKLPLVFSQYDSRWASLLLGFNTQSEYNFYNYACFICVQAMVCKYYGYDESPITLNEKYKGRGPGNGFQPGSANYVYGTLDKVFTKIDEQVTITPSLLTDAQIGEIKTALDRGFPVAIQLDYNPRTVAFDSHFVLIVDYDPNDENNFTIADPLGGKLVSLKNYLGFFYPNARKTINKYIVYEGPVPKDTSKMMLIPQEVYPNIIHGSTEWDKTVLYLLPDRDPKSTQFEEVQRVVTGYKSQLSSLQRQIDEIGKNTLAAAQEIKNREEQVGRLKTQLTELEKRKNDELTVLSKQANIAGEVHGKLESAIKQKQLELDEAMKEKGRALNELAVCMNQKGSVDTSEQNMVHLVQNILKFIFNLISNSMKKKLSTK